MLAIENVLCPLDFSAVSERELDLGVEICRRFGARLVLHHNLEAAPPGLMAVSWMWSETHEPQEEGKLLDREALLQRLLNRLSASVACEGKLSRGPLDEALVLLARELPADLLVMATHGHSTPEHRSLSERVIVESPCPVLTLREGSAPEALFEDGRTDGCTILVPVDFTDHSTSAVDYALAFSAALPVRLTLLHVAPALPHGQAPGRAEEARERLAALVPRGREAQVDCRVCEGRPSREILACAGEQGAALVIMGAHTKGLFQKALKGATASELLYGSGCPVLFVPAGARWRRRQAELAREVAQAAAR